MKLNLLLALFLISNIDYGQLVQSKSYNVMLRGLLKHDVKEIGVKQANQENDPTNTQAPRTIDAIYLRPMNNKQGGHELMNLRTGLMITRNKIHERPLTDLVIRAIETMADQQGIKTLKLTGRNKTQLYPADWIAGVE